MCTNEKFSVLKEMMRKKGYSGEMLFGFDRCKTCGGSCCKSNACAYLPMDIDGGVTKQSIVAMLDSKVAMIAGNIARVAPKRYYPMLYLTALEKVNDYGVRIGIMRSSCSLWTENGCPFPAEKRPSHGLTVIPNKEDEECPCYIDFKADVLDSWIPYQRLLEEIVKERTGKSANRFMEDELFAERYKSCIGARMVSLPTYLRQMLEISFRANIPLTIWNYTAINKLLKIRYFSEYEGVVSELEVYAMMQMVNVLDA